MIVWLRWLGVIPAAFVGFYLAARIALFVLFRVKGLCPPELVVSGDCVAPWYPLAERSVICFGAALAAFLVVLVATFVAPSHRHAVSWLAFLSGAAAAAYFAISTSSYSELASALVSGLIAMQVARHLLFRSFTKAPRNGV